MSKKKRRVFSREFKLESVRLVQDSQESVARIALNLGVGETALRRWVTQLETAPQEAFPGEGRRRGGDAELERLQRENEQLRQEREILKKATAFFAKESR